MLLLTTSWHMLTLTNTNTKTGAEEENIHVYTINRHLILIGKATLCCDISIQTVDMCDYKDKDNVL